SLRGGARLVASMSGHEAPVTDVTFSTDGRRVVSAGDDEALRVWDAATGGELASRPLDGRDPAYTSWREGVTTTHHHWRATTTALAARDGFGGSTWAAPGSEGVVRYGDAETAFLPAESGEPIAWLPGRELLKSPALAQSRVFAGGPVHVVIERG